MKIVNVHEAKTHLSALLGEVERGEEIVIARNGQPVARLVQVEQQGQRVAGSWSKQPGWETFKYDPAVFAPMTDEEMAEEGWE